MSSPTVLLQRLAPSLGALLKSARRNRVRASGSQRGADITEGFSIDVFSEMLQRFDRLRQDEFGIDGLAYQTLAATVVTWREMSHHLGRSLGPELGRPGPGL